MAVKILAHPTDDKRKASVVSSLFGGAVGVDTGEVGSTDVFDIRGFANFTIIVEVALTAIVTLKVCDTPDGTFLPLYTLGTTNGGTVLGTIATGVRAYDVPELAGCHYLKFTGNTSAYAGTIKVMGKV